MSLLAIFFAGNVHGQEVLDTLAHRTDLKSVKINDLFFEASKAKQHNDLRRAIELYEQVIVADPQNAAAYFELSELFEDDRKLDKAEANIKKAVSLAKDNKWYSTSYATILARQSKYDEAADIAAGIADRESGDASYAAQASDFYLHAKDYNNALKYIDKAVTVSGGDEEFQLQKMRIYLQMKQPDKAAEVGRLLIAQDPRNTRYYKLLGDLYESSDMTEKALQIYEEAEKAIPGEPVIEMGLAENYLKKKDTVSFRKYARMAIVSPRLESGTQIQLFYIYVQSLNDSEQNTEGTALLSILLQQHPDDAQLLSTYGDFLAADRQVEKAIEQYKKSLAIKASSFEVWSRLLNAYAFTGSSDSLVKYSEKVMRLFPNQAIVHYYNGLGHYNKKEYPAAIKAMNRAIDMAPENDTKKLADYYSMLGEVYNASKQFDESDKAFDQALKYDPQNASVLNNYAYFLSERGDKLARAKEMSEQSLKLRPGEATFLDTYGWILYKLGDYEKAKVSIEKAASDKRADGTIYEHLGDIYYKLRDKTKALENWKLAKQKGIVNPLLEKKISEEKLYE